MRHQQTLIFVYRANRGFYNTISHTMHRLFSPASYECRLCQFTSSAFGMLRPWREFIESLPEAKVFYHSKEFRAAYPEIQDELPLILLKQFGEELPHPLLDQSAIESCDDLAELIQKLKKALALAPLQKGETQRRKDSVRINSQNAQSELYEQRNRQTSHTKIESAH